jgi:cytochrome c5
MKKKLLMMLLVFGVCLMLAACSSTTEPTSSSSTLDTATLQQGKTLLEERCASCHTIEKTTRRTGSAAEWDNIVTDMIKRGANLTEDEKTVLVQYLAATYKP